MILSLGNCKRLKEKLISFVKIQMDFYLRKNISRFHLLDPMNVVQSERV